MRLNAPQGIGLSQPNDNLTVSSDISVQRLCRCDDPDDKALPTFGTGFSNGNITTSVNADFSSRLLIFFRKNGCSSIS